MKDNASVEQRAGEERLDIRRVLLESVIPWDKNPRGILRKDLDRLKRQITRLGVYKPLVVVADNGQYVVLGGNMRLAALRELDVKWVEVSVVTAATEAKKLEYALSDNDRAGYYEEEKLAELAFPMKDEIILEDFRVDLGESVHLGNVLDKFGPSDGPENEDEIAAVVDGAFSSKQLRDIIESDMRGWTMDALIAAAMFPALAAFQFNRVAMGLKDGNLISVLFTPHRLKTGAYGRRSVGQCLDENYKPFIFHWARFCVDEYGHVPRFSNFIPTLTAGVAGIQYVPEFQPSIARDLILRYTKGKKQIAVLDPCHGWGGRLIGALATMKRVRYVGVDPAPKTSRGVRRLADFLLSAAKIKALGSSVELIRAGFEDAKIKGRFDVALTSPPYFNIEDYEKTPASVASRYKNVDDFNRIFIDTLIKKTMSLLRPDGAFIVNISGDKYGMPDALKSAAETNGFVIRNIGGFGIGGHGIGRRTNSEESDAGEPFYEVTRPK